MDIRRNFLKSMGLAGAALCVRAEDNSHGQPVLPRIGIDGRAMAHGPEEKTDAVIAAALEHDITLFDTAADHMGGRSERRYGTFLIPENRQNIFLQSRCKARTKAMVDANINLSLSRLSATHLDAYLMESIVTSPQDEQVEIPDPDVFQGLIDVKKAGKTRCIGIRSPDSSDRIRAQLKAYGHEIDLLLLPPDLPENDETVRLARQKNIRIIADVNAPFQRKWLNNNIPYPSYASSWILAMSNPKEISAYCNRAKQETPA